MNQQNEKEKITTISELAVMIHESFQSNQDYMDKRFDDMQAYMDNRFDGVKKDISEVKKDLKGVEKKLDGFIERYDEDKLPMRVEHIENVLNLPKM